MDKYNVDIRFPRSSNPDLVIITGMEDNAEDCKEYLLMLEEEYVSKCTIYFSPGGISPCDLSDRFFRVIMWISKLSDTSHQVRIKSKPRNRIMLSFFPEFFQGGNLLLYRFFCCYGPTF